MKRIILAVVMSFVLLSVGQIDLSYAGAFSNNDTGLVGTNDAEEYSPIVLAQAYDEPAEEEVEEEREEEYEEAPAPSKYDLMPAVEEAEDEDPEPEEAEYEEINE